VHFLPPAAECVHKQMLANQPQFLVRKCLIKQCQTASPIQAVCMELATEIQKAFPLRAAAGFIVHSQPSPLSEDPTGLLQPRLA
jgi:hypothetical protein